MTKAPALFSFLTSLHVCGTRVVHSTVEDTCISGLDCALTSEWATPKSLLWLTHSVNTAGKFLISQSWGVSVTALRPEVSSASLLRAISRQGHAQPVGSFQENLGSVFISICTRASLANSQMLSHFCKHWFTTMHSSPCLEHIYQPAHWQI